MSALEVDGASNAFNKALSALIDAYMNDVLKLSANGTFSGSTASNVGLSHAPSGISTLNISTTDTAPSAEGMTKVYSNRRLSFSSVGSDIRELWSASEKEKDGQNAVVSLMEQFRHIPRRRTVFSSEEEDLRRREKAVQRGRTIQHLASENSVSPADANGPFALLKKVSRSIYFEATFAGVILTNSFFLGLQLQNEMTHSHDDPSSVVEAIGLLYTIAFTLELIVRALGEGLYKFVVSNSSVWNYLDIIVVFTSWVEAIMEWANRGSDYSAGGVNVSSMRMMRVLRIARLVRILRIGRVFRLVRAFRVLVFSIITTLKTVFWALLLLCTIIYLFGMLICQAVAENMRSEEDQPPDLLMYWGSLPEAMFTLFKSISGGLSWHDCVTPLGAMGGSSSLWVMIFIVYISITTLAVLNVITGVFCESAIEGAQSDRDLAVQKHLGQKQDYIKTVKQLFQDIDRDDSNSITLQEFEAHFSDEECVAFFASLDIETDMAWEIFRLLDVDEEGTIDIDEFVTGCLRLRGSAKALDVAQLLFANRRMDRLITLVIAMLEDHGLRLRLPGLLAGELGAKEENDGSEDLEL
eukprot:TRINITY_DN13805_c3_g1_i1.p1 TRINITY_DN13805_c3_g1~~TRINITY_DN13805_c3_g1_i1.p1  ORF type:complete len:581 (+),score=75.77 TRINITY_DN13805_c3_g1_i1:48-1790(+)